MGLAQKTVEEIFQKYDKRFLKEDPVALVHQYSKSSDREIAGLICSLLAFGNVKTIIASARKALKIWKGQESAASFRHRWIAGGDLLLLFDALNKSLKEYGSLENLFAEGFHADDENIAHALDHFSAGMKRLAGGGNLPRGFRYFFPSPKDGSPCKRFNMFLRWMVRPADGIDLGLWKKIPTSKLIIPLDTHVCRFARRFRLTRRKNPSWRMAVEITDFLKKLDPEDPVKFDFAICHYGMHNGRPHDRRENKKGQRGAKALGADSRLQKMPVA